MSSSCVGVDCKPVKLDIISQLRFPLSLIPFSRVSTAYKTSLNSKIANCIHFLTASSPAVVRLTASRSLRPCWLPPPRPTRHRHNHTTTTTLSLSTRPVQVLNQYQFLKIPSDHNLSCAFLFLRCPALITVYDPNPESGRS